MFRFVLASILIAIAHGRATHVRSNTFALEGRIVGGKNTTIEEHPYQLSLEVVRSKEMHMCGASLIRPNVALTAAHCTDGYDPTTLRIRAGTTTREKNGETANILNVCQHPKFTPATTDCDVSVLILDRELTLGSSIQTIDLQPENVDVPVGTVATVTGWGTLSFNGPSPSTLQEVNLPKVSDDLCAGSYPGMITENMVCFGHLEGGKDSCQRDSGGPLVVDGKQVGVVSFGAGCALPRTPGVYAKISSEEIANHINSCIANL